jgi:hypothetical protein
MGVRIIRYCGTWLLLSAICMANDATHRADIQAADCAGNAIIRRAVEAALLGRVRAPEEIQRLVAHSYDLVRAGLTRKQQAELAAPDA